MAEENETQTNSEDSQENQETQDTEEQDSQEDQDTSTETDTEDQADSDEQETEDVEDTKEDQEEVDVDKFEPEARTSEDKKSDDTKDSEDDLIDPDDEKSINKVLDKRLSPLEERIQKQNDEIEVNSFIVENPDYTRYKSVMLKYLAHPAYRNIPVKNIAAIVSAKDQQKLGAKKERVAAKKAKDTQTKGTTARKSTGSVNWLTASKEDYEKKLQEVKGMRR